MASLKHDALAIGGVEAAHAAHEGGGIQVYGYSEQKGNWRLHVFTFDVDELQVVVLTVGDLSVAICLVAVTHSVAPAQTPSLALPESEPESGQSVGWASNQKGESRIFRKGTHRHLHSCS